MVPDPVAMSRLLAQQNGMVTRRQARRLAVGDDEIRERRRLDGWASVHRGVLSANGPLRSGHLAADDPDPELLAALLTQAPDGCIPAGVAVGWTTMAQRYGFVGFEPDPRVHVVVPRDWIPRYRRPGILLHHGHTPPGHIVCHAGLPATSPAWTATTLIRSLPRERALVVADSALRSGSCTAGELAAALPHVARLRGCVQAREIVGLARPGTDSVPETLTRLRIVDAGLPEPDVDIRLYDDVGRLLARGDLGYRRLLIWLEYDGYAVHSQRSVFRHDRSRQNWLVDRGWHMLRCTDADLGGGGAAMLGQLRRALALAPGRIAALPRHLSPEVAYARECLGLDRP